MLDTQTNTTHILHTQRNAIQSYIYYTEHKYYTQRTLCTHKQYIYYEHKEIIYIQTLHTERKLTHDIHTIHEYYTYTQRNTKYILHTDRKLHTYYTCNTVYIYAIHTNTICTYHMYNFTTQKLHTSYIYTTHKNSTTLPLTCSRNISTHKSNHHLPLKSIMTHVHKVHTPHGAPTCNPAYLTGLHQCHPTAVTDGSSHSPPHFFPFVLASNPHFTLIPKNMCFFPFPKRSLER